MLTTVRLAGLLGRLAAYAQRLTCELRRVALVESVLLRLRASLAWCDGDRGDRRLGGRAMRSGERR